MSLTDHLIRILQNVNDQPSNIGDANDPNDALLCQKHNDLATEAETRIVRLESPYANAPAPIIYESNWVYVDESGGNDETGDGTDGNEYKSMQKAIDSFIGKQYREYRIRATGTFTDVTLDLSKLTPIKAFNTDDSDGWQTNEISQAELVISQKDFLLSDLEFTFTKFAGSASAGQDSQSVATIPFITGGAKNGIAVHIRYAYFKIYGDSIQASNEYLQIENSEFSEEQGANTDMFIAMHDGRLSVINCTLVRSGTSTDIEDLVEGDRNTVITEGTNFGEYRLFEGGARNKVYWKWNNIYPNKGALVGSSEYDEFIPIDPINFPRDSLFLSHPKNWSARSWVSESYPYNHGISVDNNHFGTLNPNFIDPPPFNPLRQLHFKFSLQIDANKDIIIRFPLNARMAVVSWGLLYLDPTVNIRSTSLRGETHLFTDSKYTGLGGAGGIWVNGGQWFNTTGNTFNFNTNNGFVTHDSNNDGADYVNYHRVNNGSGITGIQFDNYTNYPIIITIDALITPDDS